MLDGNFDLKKSGLHRVFESVFPIYDYSNNCKLEYTSFKLDKPEFTEEECRISSKTYSVPIKVNFKLYTNIDEKNSEKIEIFENEEVFLGELPIMTKYGTFIVNGTERVVVSQLHRSPGVFFDHDRGRTHSSGKLLFSARVIPYRGSWLDFEFDQKDIIFARIDRRRKIASTIILRALGYSTQEIISEFYDYNKISINDGQIFIDQKLEDLKGSIASFDIYHNKKLIVAKGKRITVRHIEAAKKSKMKAFQVPDDFLLGKRIAEDVSMNLKGSEIRVDMISSKQIIDPETGELICEANQKIDKAIKEKLAESKKVAINILSCNQEIDIDTVALIHELNISSFTILHTNDLDRGSFICNTLDVDPTHDQNSALIEIYRMMRPGEPPTADASNQLFTNLFQSPDRYDLSDVGRMKFNSRVGRDNVEGETILSNDDILDVLKTLINIRNGSDSVDDIDHLGNRRVKCVGEMVENVFRVGLVRVEKAVKERMTTMELAEKLQPKDIVNSKAYNSNAKGVFWNKSIISIHGSK
jgi:DNA-directed RNA polymerase subunit beta